MTMTNADSRLRAYPMRFGGGLFVACIGAAIIAAAFVGGAAGGPILLAGFALGAFAIVSVRQRVATRFGSPTRRHVWAMLGAVAFELMGFAILAWCLSHGMVRETDTFVWTIVLAIVAVHFVLMPWSFGPWMAYLGLAILVWLAGAWAIAAPLSVIFIGDGVLKILFGAIMAWPLFKQPKIDIAH